LIKDLQKNWSLEELDLGYNRCGASALAAPSTLLQSKNAKLSKLCLEYQDTGDQRFDVTSLAIALCKTKALKYLDSSGNRLDDENMSIIVAVLPNNKTLESLHLWNNNITDKGVNY
jgi:Ran GTPase-activating protein (RanGAP) involved in mRNA processing and transport